MKRTFSILLFISYTIYVIFANIGKLMDPDTLEPGVYTIIVGVWMILFNQLLGTESEEE